MAAASIALLGALLPVSGVLGDATSATAIAAGGQHTCAVLSPGGSVACWGFNYYGELGNGSTTGSLTPVAVLDPSGTSGLTGATAISTGDFHTCALLSGGSVECWGDNGNGQLGNGSTTTSSTPVPVSGITSATAISAGNYHTCALLLGGSVECWGNNGSGELGNGPTNCTPFNPAACSSSTPVPVIGITNATEIAAGGEHTCALLADGSIDCWGWNAWGQLGNGSTTDSSTPVPVIGIPVSGIVGATKPAISARDYHTCALLADGSVKCWGYNRYGQLGNGSPNGTDNSTPVAVLDPSGTSDLTNATAIAVGAYHTCALLAGSVDCWGYLGDNDQPGTAPGNSTPVAVSGITSAKKISTGVDDTCALLAGGSVDCWGYNGDGQLGNGTTTASSIPVPVSGIVGITAPDAPTGVIAAPGNTIASVSWLAPVSDGGSPITGYEVTPHDVTASLNGPTYPASGTTVTVPGLTNGDSYQFSVTATNSVGRSSDSASSDPVTLPVTPGSTTPPPATATGTASTGSTTTVSTATSPPPGGTATSVVVPAGTAGGTVSIAETGVTETAPSGYSFFVGQQVNITAPVASAGSPLVLVFQIDATLLPTDVTAGTVSVFRNDIPVNPCDQNATGASPDPCIASSVLLGGVVQLTILTSQASHWNFGATWSPPVLTVPSNISATATGSTGAVVTYSATAVNSAGQPLAPICVPASGSTFPVGTTKVGCTATDARGYTSSKSFPVTVGYGFSGFFQPLNDPISSTNPMSVFKGGTTIAVKFVLTYLNGTPILDAAAAAIATACGATISFAQTAGSAPPVDEVAATTTATTGNCFRYDSTAHQFIFNLGTKGWYAPAQYTLSASIVGPDKTLLATHRLAIGLR